MSDEIMMYVAADPTQPGAAWAACVDDPRWRKETARDVAEWMRKGAHVMRVTSDVAQEMMLKWVRPAKKERRAKKAAPPDSTPILMQTRLHSLIDAAANVAAGIGLVFTGNSRR